MKSHYKNHLTVQAPIIECDLSRTAMEASSTPEEREASQWGLALLRCIPTNPQTFSLLRNPL